MIDLDFDDFDDDYPDPSDDEFNEYEDERAALRGTSQCDGSCIPCCDWCLMAHACPEECLGGQCPYASIDPSIADARAYELGRLDAMDRTKRKRFDMFVPRRAYLRGYESWIRRNSRHRRNVRMGRKRSGVSFDIGF